MGWQWQVQIHFMYHTQTHFAYVYVDWVCVYIVSKLVLLCGC